VAIGIGIVGEGDIEPVAHPDQARHGKGRGAIHPDLPIPVSGHETEGRIDRVIHHARLDPVTLDNRLPVVNGGAAQRINPDPDAG